MKLVLHIGRPKTGTTSLQQFLYKNRKRLSEFGYFLFDEVGVPNNIDIPAYFSREAIGGLTSWARRWGITTSEEKEAHFTARNFVQNFDHQVSSASETHHTAIMTSEQFSTALPASGDIERLAQFLSERFDSVNVVCFVRSQVDLLPSSWSTEIRSGGTTTLRRAVKRTVSQQPFNYLKQAEAWSSCFGRKNVHFSRYRSDQVWDIRRRFAQMYLPDVEGLVYLSQRANSSYSANEASLVRLINVVFPFWLPGARRPNLKNRKARTLVSKFFVKKSRPIKLNSRQAGLVANAYQASNAEFSREHLSPGETL